MAKGKKKPVKRGTASKGGSVRDIVGAEFGHSPNRAEIIEARHKKAVAQCRREIKKLSQLCGPTKRRHAVCCEECRAAVQALLETEMERSQ